MLALKLWCLIVAMPSKMRQGHVIWNSSCGIRRRADVVAAADLGKGFLALVAALDRLAPLAKAFSSPPRTDGRTGAPGESRLGLRRLPVDDGLATAHHTGEHSGQTRCGAIFAPLEPERRQARG
jgi:hypothetical protein